MRLFFSIFFTLGFVITNTYKGECQEKVTENTWTAGENFKPETALTVEDLSWLAGTWRGAGLGGQVEEIWSEPLYGEMLCIFRMHKEGKLVFSEYCSFTETANGVEFRVKHFDPDFTGWESKDDYVAFPLLKVKPGEAYFDGVTYLRRGDEVTVYLRMKSNDGVSEAKFEYRRHR